MSESKPRWWERGYRQPENLSRAETNRSEAFAIPIEMGRVESQRPVREAADLRKLGERLKVEPTRQAAGKGISKEVPAGVAKDIAKHIGMAVAAGALEVGYRTFIDVYAFKYATAAAIALFGAAHAPFAVAALMIPVTWVIFRLWIAAYDKLKKDWYSLEIVKKELESREESALRKKLRNVRRFFQFSTFVPLPGGDPVIATLAARPGAEKYNGLTWKDHARLMLSTVISTALFSEAWSLLLTKVSEAALSSLLEPALIGLGILGIIEIILDVRRYYKKRSKGEIS